nr:ABC transporter ATP-binding protein [Membranihabitans marinus]
MFTVVSIPVLKPFFDVLFDQVNKTDIVKPDGFSMDNLMPFINYHLHAFIEANGKDQALLFVCGLIVVNFLVKNVFRYVALVFIAILRNGVVRDLRKRVFDTLLVKPFNFYKDERKGNLLTIISGDVVEFESSVLSVLEAIIRSPLIIIGSLSYMLYVSPTLTLYVLILIVFTAVVIGGLSRRLKKDSKGAQDLVGSMLSITEESIHGIKTIRAYHAQDYVNKLFAIYNEGFRVLRNKILFRKDLASPLSEFLGVSVVAVLLYLGSSQVFTGAMEASTFITFIFAFYNIIDPAKSFSAAYYNYQKGMGAFSRIYELLKSDQETQLTSGEFEFAGLKNLITIDGVNFKYPNEESFVLQDIHLEINQGERIALVGASGSGKTTLVDLICRFQKPTMGRILFDYVDIKEYNETSFRQNISIVSQEPVLFHDSIRNNICLNDVQHDDQRLMKACHQANVWTFVKHMEKGLDTIVGEGGGKLSGGQRQRIVLARALYFDAPILILDEATSALDSESEDTIQKAIESLGDDKTIIVIAHRLQTIKNVDRIVVLEEGRIIEQGRHDDLIDADGVYKKFVELQSFK